MKSRLSTIAIVAIAHFLLLWAIIGVLKASGFALFNLFGPPPHHSPTQEFLFDLSGWLTYPVAWLPEFRWLPYNWFTMNLLLALNSTIWGVGLGLIIYALRRRVRHTPPDIAIEIHP